MVGRKHAFELVRLRNQIARYFRQQRSGSIAPDFTTVRELPPDKVVIGLWNGRSYEITIRRLV